MAEGHWLVVGYRHRCEYHQRFSNRAKKQKEKGSLGGRVGCQEMATP